MCTSLYYDIQIQHRQDHSIDGNESAWSIGLLVAGWDRQQWRGKKYIFVYINESNYKFNSLKGYFK